MNERTSEGISMAVDSAFFSRMASRVTRSGGWISVMRPDLNRLRSRSSRVGIASGERSEERTICAPVLQEVVERVEELFLETVLALHELMSSTSRTSLLRYTCLNSGCVLLRIA